MSSFCPKMHRLWKKITENATAFSTILDCSEMRQITQRSQLIYDVITREMNLTPVHPFPGPNLAMCEIRLWICWCVRESHENNITISAAYQQATLYHLHVLLCFTIETSRFAGHNQNSESQEFVDKIKKK